MTVSLSCYCNCQYKLLVWLSIKARPVSVSIWKAERFAALDRMELETYFKNDLSFSDKPVQESCLLSHQFLSELLSAAI